MDRPSYDKRYRTEYAERVSYIKVAFAKDALTKLEARAAQDGTRLAPLVRELALSHLDRTAYVSAAVEAKLDRLVWLLANLTNNVNQMAHHSNRLRRLVDEEGLLSHLHKLERLVVDYTLDRLNTAHDHQVNDS